MGYACCIDRVPIDGSQIYPVESVLSSKLLPYRKSLDP
jgi:hypothetical protein